MLTQSADLGPNNSSVARRFRQSVAHFVRVGVRSGPETLRRYALHHIFSSYAIHFALSTIYLYFGWTWGALFCSPSKRFIELRARLILLSRTDERELH